MEQNRDKRLDRLLEKANALPMLPGVYIMRDKSGGIIYIGKAKKLKNRVSQYFRSQERHLEKVRQMVAHVSDFDYIIVDSEFEALILECSLIKQHTPKYNILLKDDKGYHYIHITNGDYRRISAEKQLVDDGGENIGPYNSSYMLRQALDEAKRIFMLPQCTMNFTPGKRTRPCLNAHIGLCSAPCAGKISQKDYNESVNGAIEFLKKGSAQTVKTLTEQMNEAAEQLQFEKAAKLRDKIIAINKLSDKQKVVMSPVPEQDVIAFVKGEKHACFEVFLFRGSRLVDRQHFFVDCMSGDEEARSQFITGYYSMKSEIPPRVLVDGEVDGAENVERFLSEKRGKSVKIATAQRGEQKQLLDMCRNNAAERIAQKEGASLRDTAVLDELRSLLGLKTVPEYIEAYDISNTQGSANVAGMIVFKGARPYKKAYKRFAVKSFEGQDDYRSMKEVLTRRMMEYELHKDDGDEDGFGRLPDLILLDGGMGQLNAVLPVLQKYGIENRAFGMVKDSHHRTRALVGQYGEIAIKPTRPVFRLITLIQDEVHRFAIGYHRKKSEKQSLNMQLCEIEGVGKKRAAALLKAFGNINDIAAASVDELAKAEGMNVKTAQSVYDFYHKL